MPKRRGNTEINAGSMADIAFLLLVFFLVTTTMSSDWGQQTLLPPYEEEETDDPIIFKERNVFVVLVNANDQLLVSGDVMEDINELKDKAKEFIQNPNDLEDLPEKRIISYAGVTAELQAEKSKKSPDKGAIKGLEKKLAAIKELGGDFEVSKGVISLQNDRGTSYERYVAVRDQLNMAYAEARNEFSKKRFGKSFEELDEYLQNVVKTAIPAAISEAEPKGVGIE